MDPGGSLFLQVTLIVVLTLVNAFFAAAEFAVISINDAKLKKMVEGGNRNACLLSNLLNRPNNFLADIQIGITLSGFLASAVASESFSDRIVAACSGLPIPQQTVRVIAVAVITILLSYFSLVFGELVPKRLALHDVEKVGLRSAPVLHMLSVVLRPFSDFLAFSTNLVTKPFGVGPQEERSGVTEDEIRMMIDAGEESGSIEESEKEMINNIFDFGDLLAGDVMTHRTEIDAVEVTSPLTDILKLALSDGYSRIPVYQDDLDDITGIIYVKDLLEYVGQPIGRNICAKDIMRPPLFVPETKKCQELFEVLTARRQHMAVVIDEYGGTAGIVTMEDLIESIVGDIQDEYDHEEQEFSVVDDSTYSIDGSAQLDEVSELLGTEFPEGEYDTLGGLVIDRLGRIPREDEHPSVEVSGVTFVVEQVSERRVEKVKAIKKLVNDSKKKDA